MAGVLALLLGAASRFDPRPIFLHYAALRVKPGESEADVRRALGEEVGIESGPILDRRESLDYADVVIYLRNHRVVSVHVRHERA